MTTFTDLLQELGIEFKRHGEHHHVSFGWIGLVHCPHCGSDNVHLGYNVTGGYMNCWRCGPHNVVFTLQMLSDGDSDEIKQKFERVSYLLPKEEFKEVGRYTPPKTVEPITLCSAHYAYLERRGFNPVQLTDLWHLAAIGLQHELAWRIFIPILYRGKPVSWTTRTLRDSVKAKYLSAEPQEESAPRAQLLYGEDYVRHAVVIVEGPADVWAIGPGAVSTFGAAYTRAQAARIAKYPVRVIVGDHDAAGAIFADRLTRDLAGMPGETYSVELRTGHDPASASKSEIAELRKRFLE